MGSLDEQPQGYLKKLRKAMKVCSNFKLIIERHGLD